MSLLMKMSLCQTSVKKNTFALSETDPRPLNPRPVSPPDILTPPLCHPMTALAAQSASDWTETEIRDTEIFRCGNILCVLCGKWCVQGISLILTFTKQGVSHTIY